MNNELMQLMTIAIVIAPITSAIMQGVKQASFINGKFTVLVAIIVAILLSVLWALTFSHQTELPLYALSGVLSGLSSSKLYDLVKTED